MTNNTMKKFLRMLGMVWGVALTVLVFAILLLKIDLVLEILSSTPVVAVICIIFGLAAGFIAGAIVCFLSTTKLMDAKDAEIKKLQNKLGKLKSAYDEACNTLSCIYAQKQDKKDKNDNDRGNQIISQIQDLSEDSAESPEEKNEEISDLQEDDFEDILSSTESETD